mgnify:CR=1 FL=1
MHPLESHLHQSRRNFLATSANGVGLVALASLLAASLVLGCAPIEVTTTHTLQPRSEPGVGAYGRREGEIALGDQTLTTPVRRVPPEKRVLVTSHDAFGYFGRAYGFEVKGLQGVSTATELGIKNRADLADQIGKRKLPAVFTETTVERP